MTDYLMRLAGRVRPAHQILQPALPSRFAPMKASVGTEHAPISQEIERPLGELRESRRTDDTMVAPKEHQTIASPELSSSRAPTLVPPSDRECSERVSLAATGQRVPIISEPVVNRKSTPEHALAGRAVENPAPEHQTSSMHHAAIPPPTKTLKEASSGNRQSTAQAHVVRIEQLLVSRSTQQLSTEGNEVRLPAVRRQPSEILGVVQPRTEPSPKQPSPVRKSTVFEPGSRSPIAPQPQLGSGDQWHRESHFSASPEIRVTIGRIEVRAITTQEPAPRRTPPRTPKLSLDEYLHSRNRGAT
jgi:hypothetical protein